MLKIEIRAKPEGVCPMCNGSGIAIPKGGETPLEVGTFCGNCDEGSRRWAEVLATQERSSI